MISIRTDTEGFIMDGRMGVWNVEVHVYYKETFATILHPKTILAMLKIPLLLLERLFNKK
jgi:hypothetical protein